MKAVQPSHLFQWTTGSWYKTIVLIIVAMMSSNVVLYATENNIKPISDAHSHNDYWRNRPILDALDHGFCSIEADVYLRDGTFWVGHDAKDVAKHVNLETVYFKTLQEWVKRNNGTVYPGVKTVTLWIDFKEDGDVQWAALVPLLEKYKDMLCSVTNGVKKSGPVQVVITGHHPIKTLLKSKNKTLYATMDIVVKDLANPPLPDWMYSAVNDNWQSLFKWSGKGTIPSAEREKLVQIVNTAHQKGYAVRFWNAPQNNNFWTELRRDKVDFISTDHIIQFQKFDQQYRGERD